MLVTGYAAVASTLSEPSGGVVRQFIPKPWKEVGMREALAGAQSAVGGRAEYNSTPFPFPALTRVAPNN